MENMKTFWGELLARALPTSCVALVQKAFLPLLPFHILQHHDYNVFYLESR